MQRAVGRSKLQALRCDKGMRERDVRGRVAANLGYPPAPPPTLFLTGRAQRLQAKSDPSVESALFHMQTSLDKMARKCRGKGGGMAGEGEQDGS